MLEGLFFFLFTFFCVLIIPFNIYAQVINEVLPNPSGDEKIEEWIEIYNPSEIEINLSGYLLEDKAGHQMLLDEGLVGMSLLIKPNGFIVIYRNGSKLSLNNTGEEIIYLYKDIEKSELLDSFSYSGSVIDRSWGRVPDGLLINQSSFTI